MLEPQTRQAMSVPTSPIRMPEPALKTKKSFSYFFHTTPVYTVPRPASAGAGHTASPQKLPKPRMRVEYQVSGEHDSFSATVFNAHVFQYPEPLTQPPPPTEAPPPARRVSPTFDYSGARHISPPASTRPRQSHRSLSRESNGRGSSMPTIPEMPRRPAPTTPPRLASPAAPLPSEAEDAERRPPSAYHYDPVKTSSMRHRQQPSQATIATMHSSSSDENSSSNASGRSSLSLSSYYDPRDVAQPLANMSLGTDLGVRGRASFLPTPARAETSLSPSGYGSRSLSASPSRSDLLNIPYSQQVQQQSLTMNHSWLSTTVGSNAALMDTRTTLEMYRNNAKKTNDPAIQYEFAVFMVNTAQEIPSTSAVEEHHKPCDAKSDKDAASRAELLKEAKHILQKLAESKSYPFAQYYLADGYASGLFNNGKPDDERAFTLFVSAGKHGHAEAGYRAALCYEYGWGCRRDYARAVQFLRQSATKNHPGAATRLGKACLANDMGLSGKQREGVKWLKRASESADAQHNAGPYELGLLHVDGFGDDVFKDERYAMELFARSANLGHPEASLRMGEAHEHGLLGCAKEPALSLHFYNIAALAGVPEAMMALCAWYMVGAEGVLARDEAKAYEWARKAAENGLPKAQYATGYFSETGIGCNRDALEAHAWYVRAAEQGEARAMQRLAVIREIEAGGADADAQRLTAEPPRQLGKRRSFFRLREMIKNTV